MNVFMFGIGGTGARILRSLTYCLAADMDNLPGDVNFVPMIIDHDRTNGDKTIAVDIMEDYRDIHQMAYHGNTEVSNNPGFFKPALKYLSEITLGNPQGLPQISDSFEFEFGVKDSNAGGSFSQYLGFSTLNGQLSESQDLLRALYNDDFESLTKNGKEVDNPIAELNLNLRVGFRGNPNIGTVVFDSIQNTDAYQRFSKVFDPTHDCVVIIGSIFGGTGSSGIPKLIEAIRTNPTAGWDTAKIACIMVMPYFKVNTPTNTEITPAIHDNIFKSKQKAALSFYESCMIQTRTNNRTMNKWIDSIYYIAENDDLQTGNPYCEGDKDQKNGANLIELVSAMGILDFVKKVNTKTTLNHYNEYGLASDVQSGEGGLQLKNFISKDAEGPLKNLTELTLAMKHFRDHIMTGKVNSSDAYYGTNGLNIAGNKSQGIYPMLNKFADNYFSWLAQLKSAMHSFEPYDFDATKDLFQVVRGFKSSPGNIFSTGVSYKDFDSIANKSWSNKAKHFANKGYALLTVLHDAAVKETTLATKTRN